MYARVLLTSIALWCSTAVAQEELPLGWRLPTKDELSYELRDKSPTRLARAVADFNGDGIDDVAILLKSTRYSGEALWVLLSDGQSHQWVKLAEIKWGKQYPEVDLDMGIAVVPPGIVSYGCFADSRAECNFGPHSQRPKLKLASPSLSYFKIDSSSSLFFWSNSYKRFLQVWLSD